MWSHTDGPMPMNTNRAWFGWDGTVVDDQYKDGRTPSKGWFSGKAGIVRVRRKFLPGALDWNIERTYKGWKTLVLRWDRERGFIKVEAGEGDLLWLDR